MGNPRASMNIKGGIEGIARNLKEMLTGDFAIRFDIGLYNGQHKMDSALQIPNEPNFMFSGVEEQTMQQKQNDLFNPTNSSAN